MLTNVPTAEGLNETALRLYFDAWERAVALHVNFCNEFDLTIADLQTEHAYDQEWEEYVAVAQPDMHLACVTIQQSAELRLKSIICSVSPYLLLLKGGIPLKSKTGHIDFIEQRTLDAVDLPAAVKTLTSFVLPESFPAIYDDMRKRRNRTSHLGAQRGFLTPTMLIDILSKQYAALWQDGKWLQRRKEFDGHSAQRYFHDYRYSSVETTVMEEFPHSMTLIDSVFFRKIMGVSKAEITGFCPNCVDAVAKKSGVEAVPTAHRKAEFEAYCLLCGVDLRLSRSTENCSDCGYDIVASYEEDHGVKSAACYRCGWG